MLLVVIYLAFVSLGLPDSLLGSAWPAMHGQLGATLAQGGIVSMVSCICTIASALATDRVVRRLGTGKTTLLSVALTAAAIFGYSTVTAWWQLIFWAVPYGLGAGAVDAALNAYVALNYEARHMNWLHCMWGVGASTGPAIMSWQLGAGGGWQGGYRTIACLQAALVLVLLGALRLWRSSRADASAEKTGDRSSYLRRPGVVHAFVGFFCYCALESTCGLWAATYMAEAKSVDTAAAAFFAALFFAGITGGRAVSGVLTRWLDGHQLQHLGEALIAAGVIVMILAPTTTLVGAGLVLAGLGCAPIYPQMIQLTPERFGEDAASALMGPQMAAAYVGSLTFPPLTGLVMELVSPAVLPFILAALVGVMTLSLNRCDSLSAARR